MTKHVIPLLRIIIALLVTIAFTCNLQASEIHSDNPVQINLQEFMTPDGSVDLNAIRMAGYEGALDLGGLDVTLDPSTGEPTIHRSHAMATSDNPDDQYWEQGPSYPGINGKIYALAVYDGRLIAAGAFTAACDTIVCNIAAWDGSSWTPLGSGLDNSTNTGSVRVLTVYNGKLIAGGYFSVTDGITANYIASWDGSSWSSLGTGTNGGVFALTTYNGILVAGGSFTTAGDVAANRIASWDGVSWTALGTGMNNSVQALTDYDTLLVAGGSFTTAGDVAANRIASWDGVSWTALGSGMNNSVQALADYDGFLVAGGSFTTAGDVAANRIASWDGVSWTALGSGMDDYVFTLNVYNGVLVAGGAFTTANNVTANKIAAWNGASWASFGSGSTISVNAIVSFDGMLICGGTFQTVDGSMAYNIAVWNDVSWASLGTGSYSQINDMIVYDGLLVAGGNFQCIDGVPANNIAAWNGMAWFPLGSGVDGEVLSLTVYDNRLIAGGSFLNAGAAPANYIASWDGISWSSIGTGDYYRPKSAVNDLTVFTGDLIACIGTREISRWNGTSWSVLTCPLNMDYYYQTVLINAMTVYEDCLIVGITYGGWEKIEVVSWNGSAWSVIKTNSTASISVLGVYDNKLYLGGSMNATLWSWNGITWTWLGNIWENFSFNIIKCFSVYDNKLIIGGSIYKDNLTIGLFAWDGSEFSFLGSGTDGTVNALADYGKLAVGGDFIIAGNKVSSSFALWDNLTPTAVLISEFNARPLEDGVELTWNLSADESIEGYRIYRSSAFNMDEIPLNEHLLGKETRTYIDWTAAPGERYRYVLAVCLESGMNVRSIPAETELLPPTAMLFQNVPNPFNPATTIRYVIPVTSPVSVRVYSSSGELVRTLVDKIEQAGPHETIWDGKNNDGSNVASGIYFYRLDAGKVLLSKKMLLLR